MLRALARKRYFPVLVAVLLSLVPVAAYLTRALDRLELDTVDLRFSVRGDQQRPKDVVVVGVDDRSINALKLRVPIDRHIHARTIDALRALGARVIAYDFQFTSPTNESADLALYDAAGRAHNLVFSTVFTDRHGHTDVLGGDANLRRIGAVAGDTALVADRDGVIRRFPYSVQGLKSFAVVAARRAGVSADPKAFGRRGAWIDYAGGVGRVRTVSLVDLLRHRVDPKLIRGHVVVVGSTSSVLQDVHPTPTSSTMPGAEIQANAIESTLRGLPLSSVPRWLAVLEIVLFTVLPPLLAYLFGQRLGAALAVLALLALLAATQIAFDSGRIVPLVYPVVGWVLGAAAAVGGGYLHANTERERLRNLFADFDPAVVEAVLAAGARADESILLDPESVIAGFRINKLIGRGGMGVVYSATQIALDREVALKLIRPAFAENPVARERFKRESKLAAAIEHPNVIPVYEAGEYESVLYIAMRLVDGEDLNSLVTAGGPLDQRHAVALLTQVAAALDAAHAAGLVHRDVKPANVLIAADELGEHAYLTDFGLTKRLDATDGLTTPGRFIGTIDYMSPEQIRGSQLGPASDVYSLGCLFHYLLVGCPPFVLASDADVIAAHLDAKPPRLPAGLESLDQVLLRAMAKDPDERYQSAGAFAQAAVAVVAELNMGAEAARTATPVSSRAPATAAATEAGSPPDA